MVLPPIPDGHPLIPKLVGSLFSGIIPQKMTDRTMRYPYTFTAKMAHFPYAHYWKKVWLYRWMFYTSILLYPVFRKITLISYSPANVEKWKDIRAHYYMPKHH